MANAGHSQMTWWPSYAWASPVTVRVSPCVVSGFEAKKSTRTPGGADGHAV